MKSAHSIGTLAFLWMVALTPVVRAAEQWAIADPENQGTFKAIDGELYLLRKGESDNGGSVLTITNNRMNIVHAPSGNVLCYTSEGDVPTVALGKKANASATWDLPNAGWGEKKRFAIRAAEGKFKGWYLDWDRNEVVIKSGEKTFHARKLLLSKDPKPIKQFVQYPLAK